MDYQIEKALGQAYFNIIEDDKREVETRVKAVRLLGKHLDDKKVVEYLCRIISPFDKTFPEEVAAEAIGALEPLVPKDKDVVFVLKEKIRSEEIIVRVAAAKALSKKLNQEAWERFFGTLLVDSRPTNVWEPDKGALLDVMNMRWEEQRRHEELMDILADFKKQLS